MNWRDRILGRLYDPDHLPEWLRIEYEREQERLDWLDTMDDIMALPEREPVRRLSS